LARSPGTEQIIERRSSMWRHRLKRRHDRRVFARGAEVYPRRYETASFSAIMVGDVIPALGPKILAVLLSLVVATAATRTHPASAAATNDAGEESDREDARNVDWSKAQLITVVGVEYEFIPNHLNFRHGMPYRLHLENRGAEMHELTAPEIFKSALVKNPVVLARDGTDLVVQPHETKDVYFVPERPGHYSMICADHDWADMTGERAVE
jgi:hypothetical protein